MFKEGDLWEYRGCVYTVNRDEEGTYYFKHPSERATKDDYIEITHIGLGVIVGNIHEGEDTNE